MRGPVAVFESMCARWMDGEPFDDVLDDEAVIETPFAPPGHPTRIVGRAAFRAYAEPKRAAFPVRFEEVRDVVVHETTEPEVIVVEYVLAGVVTTSGRHASAPFIGVLRVREGKVLLWREYQHTTGIATALNGET